MVVAVAVAVAVAVHVDVTGNFFFVDCIIMPSDEKKGEEEEGSIDILKSELSSNMNGSIYCTRQPVQREKVAMRLTDVHLGRYCAVLMMYYCTMPNLMETPAE